MMRNVRIGFQLAFGKEQLDAQTLNLVPRLLERLTHVQHLQQMMDLVLEQEQLQLPLHVLLIIHYAQLHQQPKILMPNAKAGVPHV